MSGFPTQPGKKRATDLQGRSTVEENVVNEMRPAKGTKKAEKGLRNIDRESERETREEKGKKGTKSPSARQIL